MPWGLVWTVLVVLTLVGAFLVGRRVWRALVALGEEVARAGELADRWAALTARLEDEARAAAAPTAPALGGDPQLLRDRLEGTRAVRRAARARRRDRHRRTVAEARTRWFG